jgi:hypothetical protein
MPDVMGSRKCCPASVLWVRLYGRPVRMKVKRRLVTTVLASVVAVVATGMLAGGSAQAIVGGTPASFSDYPYVGTVAYRPLGFGDGFGFCSASLIAPSWVLTAAHCFTDAPSSDVFSVGLPAKSPGSRFPPLETLIHPLWDGDARHGHDLALVRVDPDETAGLTPVAVGAPWDPGAYAPGMATIVGFGVTSAGGPTGFNAASVSLHSDADMQDLYTDNGQLLIGAGSAAHTTCSGDSGGPLVVNRGGRPVQVGVTSFGPAQCNNAGAFAELSGPQLAWIASKVPVIAAGWHGCPLGNGAIGRPVAVYDRSAVAGAVRDGPYYGSIGCEAQPRFQAAFQTPDGFLWQTQADNHQRRTANGLGVAPGTSPSVAALATGGFVTAFQAAGEGTLWTVDANNVGHDTGLTMAPNTSPAIAADRSGGWMLTFEGDTTRQWTVDSAGHQVQTPSAMAPGNSPAIAAVATGGYAMAFVASDGTLWVVNPDGNGHSTALVAGGPPAIAADTSGGWVATVAAADSRQWTVDSAGHQLETLSAMTLGTAPAIAALATGGYEMTFAASDGSLWVSDPDGNGHRTTAHVAPHTSPAITALATGGYEIAFQAAGSNHLWTMAADDSGRDTGASMPTASSPAITNSWLAPITGYAGKCLDVTWDNPANGTPIGLATCNGTNAQTWVISPDNTLRALGRCLDVQGGSTADDAHIQIWDCNGTGAQSWQPTTANELRNPQSGKCLDVTGANPADGTPLQLYHCTGSPNQKWYCRTTPPGGNPSGT